MSNNASVRPKLKTSSESLANQAYLIVRERILRADYPFGTVLSPRRLARQLGMSLVPVAEALQQLEHEELVERRARAGTRVKIPTPDEIRGFYVIREALESQAARLCAVHATAAERVELRRLAAALDGLFAKDGAPDTGDREKLYQLHTRHVELHSLIAECARCRTLSNAIGRNHVLLFNFLYDVAARRTHLPPGFHADLIEAIVRGDPEKADAAMRVHVKYGLSETLLRLQPQIHKGSWRLRKKRSAGTGQSAAALVNSQTKART